jgi:hypothetical protein
MTASRAVWNALVSVLLIQAFPGPPAGAGEAGAGPTPKDNPIAGYYAQKLRDRAKTPEGQVILKRLRVQLDGSDGETMPSLLVTSGRGPPPCLPRQPVEFLCLAEPLAGQGRRDHFDPDAEGQGQHGS